MFDQLYKEALILDKRVRAFNKAQEIDWQDMAHVDHLPLKFSLNEIYTDLVPNMCNEGTARMVLNELEDYGLVGSEKERVISLYKRQ